MKRFTLSVMVLMAFLCVVLLSPFAPSESTPLVSAAATWKPFPGRLAYSCDGGYHDKDDIAANPFLLLLLYKAGLADKLVHFEYANHIWLSDATQLNSLISATNEAVTRFGFNPNIFYNCMNANKDPIYNHLRDEILASTASNPLTICGAGPMHTIYQALSRANAQDPSKLQYVTVISHSPKTGDLSSNNEHGLYDHAKAPDPTHTHKNPTAKVWDDIAADFPSVKLVIIRGQNGPGTTALERNAPYDFRVADSYNAEQWMEDSTDDDIRWVWENMNAVHGTLNDVSDAGMVWYWMTGGDAYGDFVKTKVALTSDYILDLNFNSDTLSSPPSGWVDITGDVTIANVPSVSYVPAVPDKAMENTHFKDKCIKINDTTSSSCTATKVFADQSADFVVDYDFMVSTASADYVGIEVKNSTGDAAVMVKTVGSNISYKTGGSWTPITSYTQNKWHHITIYANKGTNKCSIIVDGKLEVDNLDMATVSNPINNITFKTGTTYQGVAYFDNLKIFSPSAAPTPTPTPSPTPTPAGDYLIDDNFNNQSAGSTPTGWTVSGDVKVANIPSASDKSIKFNDTDASTLTAVKGFAQQTGAITVEYDFMVPATVDFAGLQLEDGSGTTAIVLKTRYGQIAYKKSDDSWANLQAYNPNTWYSIRIGADASTDTYSVYVNGVERANGVAFNRAVSSIEQIKFTTGSSYTGLMYVDNVKVSGESSYFIDDNFNNQSAGSTPTGWTVSGDVKVANIPSASDKSIKFNDTDASTLTAVKGFAQQTGAITVEYDFMVPATVDFAGLQLEDGSGTTAIVLKTRYGQIAYKKSDDNWANLQAYNPNTWYSIRIEADVSTDTYSVYVNGVERANGVAFNRAVSSIEQIKFTTGSSYTGLMYVDNVKVYKP